METTLENLGWNDFFESKRAELGLDGFTVARVVAEYRGAYKVKNEKGEFLAKIKGKQIFRAQSREDYPAVGDWVAITDLGNEQAIIETILPRQSVIKRRFGDKNRAGEKSELQIIAANIDTAFIVQSFGRDYNVNRFERYLAILEDAGIRPAIILNKIDLVTGVELARSLEEIEKRLGSIDVIATSTVDGQGLDQLRDYIEKGQTYCFLGSSGVGKSSLINKLKGKEDVRTREISSYSERGKHVTTKREMYFLSQGGIVIDNPGIREVGLADAGTGIAGLFDEIAALAKGCKFVDCTHISEPGCEVLRALEEGRLDEKRYQNYIDLKKESEFFEMNAREKREKNRNFGKFKKKAKKEIEKFRA